MEKTYVNTEDNQERMNRGIAPIGLDGVPNDMHSVDGNKYSGNVAPILRSKHKKMHSKRKPE